MWSCDVCFRRRRTPSPKLQRGRGKAHQLLAPTVTDRPITRQLASSRSDHWERSRPLPPISTDRHGRGGAPRRHVGTDFHMRLTDQTGQRSPCGSHHALGGGDFEPFNAGNNSDDRPEETELVCEYFCPFFGLVVEDSNFLLFLAASCLSRCSKMSDENHVDGRCQKANRKDNKSGERNEGFKKALALR